MKHEHRGVGQQEREATSPSWLKFGVGTVLLALVAIFVADQLFNPSRFQITEIEVHGKFKNVNGEQITRTVEGGLNGNYFSLSLRTLESEIEKLPWVYTASLRRRWPSSLIVEVVEIQPVAIWGEGQWLNFTGDLVSQQPSGSFQNYSQLPRLSGPENEIETVWQAFRHWSGKFASTGLSLEGLSLQSSGLWHLSLSLGALARSQTESPVTVEPVEMSMDSGTSNETEAMPEEQIVTMIVDDINSDYQIDRFIKTLNQHLIVQFPSMQSIDLRYPNGFAIGWNEGVQPAPEDEGVAGVEPGVREQ